MPARASIPISSTQSEIYATVGPMKADFIYNAGRYRKDLVCRGSKRVQCHLNRTRLENVLIRAIRDGHSAAFRQGMKLCQLCLQHRDILTLLLLHKTCVCWRGTQSATLYRPENFRQLAKFQMKQSSEGCATKLGEKFGGKLCL